MSKKWRNGALSRNFVNVDEFILWLMKIEQYFNGSGTIFFKNGFFVQALIKHFLRKSRILIANNTFTPHDYHQTLYAVPNENRRSSNPHLATS